MKRKFIFLIASMLIISMVFLPVNNSYAQTGPFVTEVIVRTVDNFKNHNDVVKFMNNAKKRNVSVINLNVKEDEDDAVPSGYVFYPSTIAPIAAGYANFDAVKDVIKKPMTVEFRCELGFRSSMTKLHLI